MIILHVNDIQTYAPVWYPWAGIVLCVLCLFTGFGLLIACRNKIKKYIIFNLVVLIFVGCGLFFIRAVADDAQLKVESQLTPEQIRTAEIHAYGEHAQKYEYYLCVNIDGEPRIVQLSDKDAYDRFVGQGYIEYYMHNGYYMVPNT